MDIKNVLNSETNGAIFEMVSHPVKNPNSVKIDADNGWVDVEFACDRDIVNPTNGEVVVHEWDQKTVRYMPNHTILFAEYDHGGMLYACDIEDDLQMVVQSECVRKNFNEIIDKLQNMSFVALSLWLLRNNAKQDDDVVVIKYMNMQFAIRFNGRLQHVAMFDRVICTDKEYFGITAELTDEFKRKLRQIYAE